MLKTREEQNFHPWEFHTTVWDIQFRLSTKAGLPKLKEPTKNPAQLLLQEKFPQRKDTFIYMPKVK